MTIALTGTMAGIRGNVGDMGKRRDEGRWDGVADDVASSGVPERGRRREGAGAGRGEDHGRKDEGRAPAGVLQHRRKVTLRRESVQRPGFSAGPSWPEPRHASARPRARHRANAHRGRSPRSRGEIVVAHQAAPLADAQLHRAHKPFARDPTATTMQAGLDSTITPAAHALAEGLASARRRPERGQHAARPTSAAGAHITIAHPSSVSLSTTPRCRASPTKPDKGDQRPSAGSVLETRQPGWIGSSGYVQTHSVAPQGTRGAL